MTIKSKFNQSEWEKHNLIHKILDEGRYDGEILSKIENYKKKNLIITPNIQELFKSKIFMLSFSYLLENKTIRKINIDSKLGKKIGFTSDKFIDRNSLIVLIENNILILLIESKKKRKGYFTNLTQNIINNGYDFTIHEPFPNMIKWAKKTQLKGVKQLKCVIDNGIVRSMSNGKNKMANMVYGQMGVLGMIKEIN